MSDLQERYPKSKQLHTGEPPESTVPAAEPEPEPTARETFLDDYPELARLRKGAVDSSNRTEIMEKIKAVRVGAFREAAATREHDLSTEEVDFLADVLALRIHNTNSVREMLDRVGADLSTDFDNLRSEVGKLRRTNARLGHLGKRYSSMTNDPVTPHSHLYGRREPSKPKAGGKK